MNIYEVNANDKKQQQLAAEKEEIKKIVMQFANEVHSKPLGSIISNLKDKFKPYFHVASPYLQMLFSYFLRTQ